MYEWSEDLCNDPDGIRDIFFTKTIKLYSYENIPAKMRDTRERYDFNVQLYNVLTFMSMERKSIIASW